MQRRIRVWVRSIWNLSATIVLLCLPGGCMHVRLGASDMLAPDDPPVASSLPAGYVVEDALIRRAERVIGITRAHRPGNRVVVIFCGGDSFRRSREGGSVLAALARDADVVLFDYPGFGTSTGSPTPDALLDNARATADYVARLPHAAGQQRLLYGFSLGGMVAAELARERPFDAMILEATAPDVASWARTQIPWYAKPFVRVDLDPVLADIDSVRALQSFSGRILILAGGRDEQAPPALSRKLAQGLTALGRKAELREFPDAKHGEIYKAPTYRTVIDPFLASLVSAR
ncbi:MAG TPA: alpha/beta fold hydrolase [Steroidobacteraceae bacterium]|nr:alpha/beta fold hydrolase [Steroidobacteraceae bacterium]